MTDLQQLLTDAAHRDLEPASAGQVDADVRRGHRALTRRRMRRTGTRSMLVGALAVGGFALLHPQGRTDPSSSGTVQAGRANRTTGQAGSGIRLVDYVGAQPAGFTVDQVPDGWEVQGVNAFDLRIVPSGDPTVDPDPEDMVGKLTVTLDPPEETGQASMGTSIAVGTGTGRLDARWETDVFGPILHFQSNGRWVRVQVPQQLNWSDAEIGQFAAGVHVTPDAVQVR